MIPIEPGSALTNGKPHGLRNADIVINTAAFRHLNG
jgi:hypothetical protein